MQHISYCLKWARTAVARGSALGLVALGLTALAPGAQAQSIYGLGTITGPNIRLSPVGSQGLIIINPNDGSASTLAPVAISNIPAGQTLVGIDYRPADNLLYALGYDATTAGNNTQLFVLDPGTNTVTAVGGTARLELGGPNDRIGFDFNPTVDRIRVVSSNKANYRLNPSVGAASFVKDTDLNYAGGTPANPGVGTAAYTNPFLGSISTTLYDIDFLNAPNNGILSIQTPPNAGTLTAPKTVMFQGPSGNFGVGAPLYLGLDIYFNVGSGQNVGYLTEVTERDINNQSSSNTYRFDLNTGQGTLLGNTLPRAFNFEIRDLAVAIAPVPTATWTGAVSTAWNNPANWSTNQVPGPANDVVIPAVPRQPTVSTSQQSHALTLNPGAQITLADGSFLVVGANFTNNGNGLATTGVGTGTLVLDLNTPQVIGGTSATVFPNLVIGAGTASLAPAVSLAAPASVRRVLTLYGNLTVTGQTFTLLSDAANTAMVVNELGGTVVGPTIVQRYITPTNPGLGYRHYSAPTNDANPASPNSKVADLTVPSSYTPVVNANYNTVGNSVTPFPTVFGYNEQRVNTSGNPVPRDFDKGFFSPNALNDPLEVTRGYTVNIPGTVTVDFVGTLNDGPLSATGLTRGGQAESGWHLRGNPYPAPLNWDLMVTNGRLTNIENALYVFKSNGQYTGSYTSYVNGQAVNTGTNILPSSQGFFVRTTAGQTGNISFTNTERLTTYNNTPFQRGTADARPQLTLGLGSATARTQTVVYFERGATAGFDAAFDARALPGANGLLLATETAAAESLSINGQPVLTGADALLPLRLAAATTGTYTLAVDNLTNLPAGYHAYLRDALTGTYTDLAAAKAPLSLALVAGASAGGRYAVLFTTQARVLATAPAALAQLASVYPNPARGTATVLLPAALRAGQATVVSIIDNLGREVLRRTLPVGATETLTLPLAGLAPGVYSVQAHTAAGLVAKRLVVQ